MPASKAALKSAKAALDAHKYEEAIEQAKSVLGTDPTNYNANVFIGLAYDKQGQNDSSESAYRTALKSKDKDPLAWQGLISLYEKQAGDRLDAYHEAVIALAEIFMTRDDRNRCQAVLDKYTVDAKKYGSRSQFKHSLEVYLPTGSLYEYLEGRIPQPAQTYSRIAELAEAEEKEKINSEVGQRRTRLGAKIDQVIADVRREVLNNSQLEALYGAVIDWAHEDDVRRQYEEKLLHRVYDHLEVLPSPSKSSKRTQVQKLADGLVILKHPFHLAWSIKLEWSDIEEIKDLDIGLLREHINLFPQDGLSKVLKGYLNSDLSLFKKAWGESNKQDGDEESRPMTAEDRLILMSDGIEESRSSILAHRIMAQYYLELEEFESAAATARRGQDCIQLESNRSGLRLAESLDAMNMILATTLVQFQAPRHHPEATELFERILNHKPTATSALLGIGMIMEEQEDYAKAVDFLSRAFDRSKEPRIRAELAWCKALGGDDDTSLRELEACLPELEGSDTRVKSLHSQTLYRIGKCIWNRDSSTKSRKSRNGAYSQFLAALQADLNNAPAYTSLGIYYADYAKDRKRSRKCFQKAFELSSSEVEAAHRLAESFAQSKEWDLVEIVAQRVIESGKIRPAPGSKRKPVSWPFSALGVVQLNNQEYTRSIVSFQSVLRIAPADYHSWVGLGESYHNCGRYIAATRAFEQAQKLESTSDNETVQDSWFSRFMLANVRRELGDYDDAITGYQAVLEARPSEFGVSIALLQCLVEGALRSVELGLFGRAANGAQTAINTAQELALRHDAFNLWKAVGDACSIFTYVQIHAKELPRKTLRNLLTQGADLELYNNIADIDGISQGSLDPFENVDADNVLLSIYAAILAQKRAIHACANDVHAKAVAWYNLGWTEYRAYVCTYEEKRPLSKKESLKHMKASVQCFKRAIEFEAGNAEFWNSLGIVTTDLSPKASQHSFVRSLHLNDKNARVWTNLGTLYFIQEDYQLANEAFARAQSSDPDYAQAWVGQALLARQLADPREARLLFTHAFEIANSSSTIIKQQYAISTFDHLVSTSTQNQNDQVLQPLFALHQLRAQVSADLAFQHLLSLFAERIGDYEDAVTNLEYVSNKLEAEYEISEDPKTMTRFAQAKADLARVQLASRDFDEAGASAETALDLSEGEDDSEVRQKLRLSAHMTAGLAYYYKGTMDQAISMFRSVLEETSGDPDIICLLAQVLWAKGGDDEHNIAREQLFNCIEKHPAHVEAVTLLGAIAVLDQDTDTIEAVTADLHGLRARDDLDDKQQGKINQLLTIIASHFSGGDGIDEARAIEARTAVMLAPSKPHGWSQLADLSEDIHPAEMAVLTATKAVPPKGALDAVDLAKTYSGTGRAEDAQRAVQLAPWIATTWEAFGYS